MANITMNSLLLPQHLREKNVWDLCNYRDPENEAAFPLLLHLDNKYDIICSRGRGCRFMGRDGGPVYARASWWDGDPKQLIEVSKDQYYKVLGDLTENKLPGYRYLGSINGAHIAHVGDVFKVVAVRADYSYYPENRKGEVDYYLAAELVR